PGSCRRSAPGRRTCRRDPLGQLDPGAAVALLDLVGVADGVEHALQIEIAVRGNLVHLVRREGPERGMQHPVIGREGDDELSRVVAEAEQRLDPDLQVVEVIVRHVEPHREAAGDEVRDRPEVLLRRDDEPAPLGGHAPASRSSSTRSLSRRAAASFPAWTAWRQSRRTLKSAAPKLTPVAKPDTFCTGRVIAKLTARTAVSTLSAASTALSVILSTLSSCPFTLSTLPPTLSITGRADSPAPRMNVETSVAVPARRTNRYASEIPTASRKTASAS